jgi:hypothetical protein
MALAWIGVAIGVLILVILIVKLIKTPKHEAVSIVQYCKTCGLKTNGLKCPKCDRKFSFGK